MLRCHRSQKNKTLNIINHEQPISCNRRRSSGLGKSAVRSHRHLPLALRTADTWLGGNHGHRGNTLLPHRRAVLERRGTLLAETLRSELRNGCGDRHHPRVRVRNQLEQLLMDCGRHLRRATRYRRHCGILHGEYIRCRDVLRVAESVARIPSRINMAYRTWRHHLGMVDSRG